MNICAWKEKKNMFFIHHVSFRTVHIHAVVQIYTELSKHLKNMKTSIHFHLTKSRSHLIFSKTNTRMPLNRHSDICSSIWLAAPIGRWAEQKNEHSALSYWRWETTVVEQDPVVQLCRMLTAWHIENITVLLPHVICHIGQQLSINSWGKIFGCKVIYS